MGLCDIHALLHWHCNFDGAETGTASCWGTRYCAYTICFFASVHILAHFYNINNMVTEDRYVSEAERIVGNEDNAENVAFTTWPGITGLVITFALILIVTTAVETIRRSYFELFWYTHHLFVVFFIALMIHGNSGFIKFQENFKYVPYTDDGKCIALTTTTQIVPTDNYRNIRPTTCVVPSDFDGNETYRVDGFVCGKNVPPPLFCYNINGNPGFPDTPAFNELPCCNCLRCSQAITPNGGPATWYWVILPFFIYLCERLFRLYKSQCRKLKVLKIIRHNDSTPVMEVQIQKVKTKAGQYAFLHCPSVSCTEWHPFTLTSCPEDEYISFHIRLVGDWTCALAERCGFYSDVPLNIAQLPNVAIDGPFGTSSEDIFRYETGVCVCAGIGVTPFASLLKELFYRKFTTGAPALKCKTVYFYWICPGFDSWSWFSNLLVEFESQCHEANDPDFLQIRIHMSRGWSKDDAEKLYLQDSEEGDSVVKDDRGRRLKAKMNFGRPNWDVEFSKMKVVHSGTVGVFFCGPKVLPPKETLACAPSDSLFTNIGPSPGKYLNPFLVRA